MLINALEEIKQGWEARGSGGTPAGPSVGTGNFSLFLRMILVPYAFWEVGTVMSPG